MLFLATTGSACLLVRQFNGRSADDGIGDGQSAWNARVDKYDSVTKEVRKSCYVRLTNMKMRQRQDPKDYFYKFDELRDRLTSHGELISVERCEDTLHIGLTEYYECVKEKTCIDGDLGMDSIRTMMRNILIDKLSRFDSSNSE